MSKYREWILEILPHFSPSAQAEVSAFLQTCNEKNPQTRSKALEYRHARLLEERVFEDRDFSPRVEIHRHIQRSEWLYLKGLHTQAFRFLEKAMAVAVKFEFLEEWQVLLEWKWKLNMAMEREKEALAVLEEMAEAQARLAELRTWKFHFTQALVVLKHGRPDLADRPEFTSEPVSIRAKLMFLVCQNLHQKQRGQIPEAEEALARALLLIHRHPQVGLSNPALVIQIYFQQLQWQLQSRNLPAFRECLKSFENQIFLSRANQDRVRLLSLFFLLKGSLVFPGEIAKPELSPPDSGSPVLPDWNLAIVVFLLTSGSHHLALPYIQRELKKSPSSAGPQRTWLALGELLALFDLGHFDLIPYRANALKKRLKRQYETRMEWLDAFISTLQESAKAERLLLAPFHQTKSRLDAVLSQLMYQDLFFVVEDLRLWVGYKLDGR